MSHIGIDHNYVAMNANFANLTRFKQVSIDNLQDEGYAKYQDYKMVVAYILILRHNSSGVKVVARRNNNSLNRQPWSRNINHNIQQGYNQLLIIGCVLSGKCGIIVMCNSGESETLLRNFKFVQEGVGCLISILEPDFATKSMYGMPIIKTDKPLVPINYRPHLRSFSFLSENTTTWFLHTGKTVIATRAIIQQAKCSGYLCDKQMDVNSEGHCGCLHTSNTSGIVLHANIIFQLGDTSQENDRAVVPFQSHRFTGLFIDNSTRNTSPQDFEHQQIEVLLRTKIYETIDIVNNNGGWTIAGWIRLGSVQDFSGDNSQQELISSEDATPHIIYVQPTNDLSVTLRQRKTSLELIRQELHQQNHESGEENSTNAPENNGNNVSPNNRRNLRSNQGNNTNRRQRNV